MSLLRPICRDIYRAGCCPHGQWWVLPGQEAQGSEYLASLALHWGLWDLLSQTHKGLWNISSSALREQIGAGEA